VQKQKCRFIRIRTLSKNMFHPNHLPKYINYLSLFDFPYFQEV
jgi:hypothetical protein